MKKENRILYRIALLLLACLAVAVWASDFDSDGMDDSYESFFGLNTNNAMDALLDPDGDSLTNWQESVLWTDPFIPDTDKDGWADGSDSNPLSRAVFRWGDAQFTSNDVYAYTFPAWCSHGFQTDGTWTTNGWTADSSLSSNTGALNIQVLRELLTNNAVLDVELFDATNSSLFVALCDTNQDVIVSNLYGQSIVTGSQVTVTRRLAIPFASYSNASIVRLWRGTGDITIYGSLMYIDEDGDGLDTAQELQAGTSDSDTDSDDDGLNDFAELMLTHTDPLNTDTDNDGYSDYVEFMAGSNPNSASSLPVSAVSVFGTVNYSGSETGKIYVAAVTASDEWGLTRHAEIAEPGAYSITNVSVLSSGWIKAWRDSNGNGVRDPWEAQGAYAYNPLYLSHPASNVDVTLVDFRQDYSIPFAETFEAVAGMAGTPGSVNGQHGWSVSGTGTATVQSNTVSGGAQALKITYASASHEFVDGQTEVWVSYRVKAVRGSAPQNIPTNIAVVFYVNSAGNLCVYSNQTAVALPVTVPDGWSRFDFHCDYTAKRWDLRFNRERVVSGFPFYGSPSAFNILRLDGKGGASSYMDDVQVVFANPDRDDDGYTNDEETQAGSNPDDAQSLPPASVSGQIAYSGSSTGTIHVVAVAGSSDWNTAVSTTLTVPGSYSIANVPALTNIWVKAWLDSDSNGLCDPWEAQGSYVSNPLCLRSPVSAINLTLTVADLDGDGLDAAQEHAAGTSDTDPDCDDDGLSDYEEVIQTRSNPLNPDTDDDGISDFDEVRVHGSSPLSADTDNDGLSDAWEIANGLNPALFADCMSDPDGDGFGTIYEVRHGTAWNNGADYPAVTAVVAPGQKIQDAINAAGDYAIIRIEPGTYTGLGNRNLHFDGKPMMLTAEPGTVILNADSTMAIHSFVAGQDIRTVVDGLTIRNASQYAVYFQYSGLTLRNCVIENNGTGATSGAGLYLSAGTALVENCVFSGNISSNGGAIYAYSADLELRNCTLISNRAISASGTIRFNARSNTLTIVNSMIWEAGTNPVHLSAGRVNISHSCVKGGYAGEGNISADPQVLGNGYHLHPASPCIDAGTASGAPAADIAGHGRTGAPDIGAWEYSAAYADTDGDGWTDAEEAGVSDPFDVDSLPVSEVTVSGAVGYDGIQGGTIRVLAVTDPGLWTSAASAQLAAPGAYSIANVPVLTPVWIKAWMDSNGNGLCDSWEAQSICAGPLSLRRSSAALSVTLSDPDTDGDGLPDWREMILGTDVNNSDTDGDGLSDYAEVESAYKVVWKSLTWNEAKLDAEFRGGCLAVITSEKEHNRLVSSVGNEPFEQDNLWIGASDEAEEGVWVWVTGEPFDYTRWDSGAPNPDSGNTADGLAYRKGAAKLWDDLSWKAGGYILEYRSCTGPLNPDSDGDGVNDGTEIALGINPRNADTDGDKLSDGDEVQRGTDPLNPDTDGDGLMDGDEVPMGTNPLLADTDDDGLSDKAELHDLKYRLVMECLPWDEARLAAQVRGGHLATVSSEEEHQKIRAVVGTTPLGLYGPWIGATDGNPSRTWGWVTGEPFVFSRWAPDALSEGHGAHYRDSSWWDSVREDIPHPYLLEYETSLDPLNSDTDGDGIPDGQEILMGLSPLSADTDGDGIPDGQEISLGLNPAFADTDGDWLSDSEELAAGTDPLNPDRDGDGLLDGEEIKITQTSPVAADSNGNDINDMVISSVINGADASDLYNAHIEAVWSRSGSSLALSKAIGESSASYQSAVETPGIYRFAIQASWASGRPPAGFEPRVAVYVDGRHLTTAKAVSGAGGLPEYVCYTPWLVTGTHEIKLVPMGTLRSYPGVDGGIVIDRLEFCSIDGVDADGDGIQDWMQALMAQSLDSDSDGIADIDEIRTHGTDPLNADTDGDGLKDGAELAAGTNPLDADSDDDGVNDGPEVNELLTNPLVAEFDGTSVNVLTIAGAATNGATGEWHVEGTAIHSESRRGELQYLFTLPTQDMYRVEIEAAHLWSGTLGSSAQTEDTSGLDFYVDGLYVGTRELVSVSGTVANLQIFLPVLAPGEHTLTVFWENLNKKLVLKVNELRFQQLGGPDANVNGVKDWVEASLDRQTGLDAVPAESYVSPLCIEGTSRYVPMMGGWNVLLDFLWLNAGESWCLNGFPLRSGDGGLGTNNLWTAFPVHQGAGSRWYADLPLDPLGNTVALMTFQNNAFIRKVQTRWVPYNLLEHAGQELVIRTGDSVKFRVQPPNVTGGSFSLKINGGEICSQRILPVIHQFTEPGVYTVSGEHKKLLGPVTAGSVTVRVVGFAFPEENPGCMVGRTREWMVSNVPTGVVFETDNTVELGILEVSPSTNNQQQTTLSLMANEVNGTRVMVARLGENGPIMNSTKLNPFWVQSGVDHYMRVVERYADSELWETTMVEKHLPAGVDVLIDVFGAGILLDDYTIERTLTKDDFEANGEYIFRLFHPNDREGSTCYRLEVHQDEQQIGEIR